MIFAETVVSAALIIVIIVIDFTHKDILLLENARIIVKKNLGKLRASVLMCLMSLHLFILGESVKAGVRLGVLPANYEILHGGAEIIHLALLVVGLSLGLWILSSMKDAKQ